MGAADCIGGSYRVVVFDLDGTLYPRGLVKKAMIRRLFPRIFLLKKYTDARNRQLGCDYKDADAMRDAIIRSISGKNERTHKRIERWLERRYYPALAASIARISARTGFPEFIVALRERGIRMAVVSDYGQVEERLLSLGFDPGCFELLLGTEELGMMKPAPRINQIILDTFRVKPDEILVVGDRADTDLALAVAGGMGFLGISERENSVDPDLKWQRWPDFKATLEALLLK